MILGCISARIPNRSGLGAIPVQDCCLWLVLRKAGDGDESQREIINIRNKEDFLQYTEFYIVHFKEKTFYRL